MTNKISDNLIEEILNDIKEKNGETVPQQEYSSTDIDLLLAEISGEAPVVKEFEDVFSGAEIKEEEKPAKKSFFSFDISRIQSFDDEDDEIDTTIPDEMDLVDDDFDDFELDDEE